MTAATRMPFGCLLVVALLVAFDQWSKAAIFEWLGGPNEPPRVEGQEYHHDGHLRYPLVGEWLALMPQLNRGAAFGRFQNVPHLLVGGRALAVLFLLVLVWRTEPARRALRTALVLVLAGAIGNLCDNLLLEPAGDHPYGAVRDFIDVYFGIWDAHFPTFNVADSCITVGAVLLLLSGFFERAKESADPADKSAGDAREQAA